MPNWNQTDEGNIGVLVEITLNGCANVYGSAPCTANREPGQECYNTFATCQDQPNYVPEDRVIRLSMVTQANQGFLGGAAPFDTIPCITQFPTMTPTTLKRGDGVATRGKVDIICTDIAGAVYNPRDPVDLYRKNRIDEDKGSFWGRMKALFPYYQRAPVEVVYYRHVDDAFGFEIVRRMRYRLLQIDGPTSEGQVKLRCDDLLGNLADEDVTYPATDSAVLAADITKTATTITITNEDSGSWPAGGGHFAIEGEVIRYASYSAGTLSGCTRGLYGTLADSHDAGEPCTITAVWDNVNVVDILSFYCILSGIDPAYIPYNNNPGNPDEWDFEKDRYLAGHNLTFAISEPTKLIDIVDQLCEQCYINLWWDPDQQKVRLSATNTALASQTARPITDTAQIIDQPMRIVELPKRMISQAWAYYDKTNVLAEDRPSNFANVAIEINTELESANAWGEKRINILFGSYLTGAGNVAIITNNRIISERSRPQYEMTFSVDGGDPVFTGEYLNIRTDLIQNPDGTPQDLTWQVIKVKETVPTARLEVTAASIRPTVPAEIRFANIVNVANEGVEYGDATDPDRAAWGWIAAVDGFENKDDPYWMS